MLLIVTNRKDAHADLLIQRMYERGITKFIRLNTELFPGEIMGGMRISDDVPFQSLLQYGERIIDSSEVQTVWYRRPISALPPEGLSERHQQYVEFQADGYLRGLWNSMSHSYWVSHPSNIRIADRKPEQLQRAREFGFNIPNTLITNSPAQACLFAEEIGWNLLVKCVDSRVPKENGREVTLFSRLLTREDKDELESVRLAPVILQEYVPKSFEIRVTVIGDRLFPVKLDSQSSPGAETDWRALPPEDVPHEIIDLGPEMEALIIKYVQSYNLEFGTVDLIVTPDDKCVFLELNPNGQWVWMEQLLGKDKLPMRDTMIDLLLSK